MTEPRILRTHTAVEDGMLSDMQNELTRLRSELEKWRTWGVIEVAIRNQNVADYCNHWEKRTEKAEQQNKRLREALKSIGGNSCCDSCYETSKVARAALTADQSEGKE